MKLPLTLVESDAERLRATRSCGTCTSCCVLPRIVPEEDFPQGKPGYTPCNHLLCGVGCGVYEDRPSLCRIYECLWRSGLILGDERRRPDNLGLMLRAEPYGDEVVIEAWELWDDAAYDHPGRGIIDSLAKRWIVAIRFYGVPISLEYRDERIMELGRQLSRASREDPRALADWCRLNVLNGRLQIKNVEAAMADLDSLARGKPIPRHYKRA